MASPNGGTGTIMGSLKQFVVDMEALWSRYARAAKAVDVAAADSTPEDGLKAVASGSTTQQD